MFQRIVQFIIFLGSFLPVIVYGQSSVLSAGDWFKVGVVERGIYQMDYDFLKDQGVPVASIDPATFQLFGNGGNGTLPQANDAIRPEDLLENSIRLVDGGDGSFDPGDFLLFFGNTADKLEFDREKFQYEDNIYSDTVFYFLTYNQKEGMRIEKTASTANPSATADQVYSSAVHDVNEFNLLNSGRLWFGEGFDKPGRSKKVELFVPETSNRVTLDVSVMASSISTSFFDIGINGVSVGTIEIPARSGVGSLSRGFVEQKTFTNDISGGPLEINFVYRSEDGNGFGFIDNIVATVESGLTYENHPFFFSVSTGSAERSFTIQNNESGLKLWNITIPNEVEEVEISSDGTFSVHANTMKNYSLFSLDESLEPVSMVHLPNQNLHSMANVDFLIITHPLFKKEADRLAKHRIEKSGLNSRVVTIDKIYNEFSSGSQDITSIRDFIRYLYERGDLRYVLLFGDASYDYKDRITSNTNFVPTYQSRNSLNLIFSYSSDDYYAFMETDEGEWEENNSGNHSMDISIGRLPVRSKDQAAIIVDKIIHYETHSDPGPWRSRILFAADDGDENLHHTDADILANGLDEMHAHVAVNKLYLDAFPQVNQSSEAATKALERQVHEGVLVVDYTGHGNELQLAAERLVAEFNINLWTNKNTLPFFVTATCEFGVFDNPDWYSSGERLLFHPEGGGIGLISSTRVVLSGSNFLVNRAFSEEVFSRPDGQYQTVGELFMRVKNKSLFGRSNRNYALLADPSMKLNYPDLEIKVDSVTDHSGNRITDFHSFSEITLFGSVHENSQLSDLFNGEAEMVLYDHPKQKITLGDQNEPFRYEDRNSILFSGTATVDSGRFQVKVLLPEGITGHTQNAKMILYARDSTGTIDAGGGLKDLVFQTGDHVISDTKPPQVKVYVGDTLFQNHNNVPSNTNLLVHIRDESGVNLSHKSPTNILRAELNGEEIILSEYYKADLNTYKSGKIVYPFRNLPEGDYKLKVFVSDIAGNKREEEVRFSVVTGGEIAINNFKVFPNPSAGDVTFSFHHDRATENLLVEFRIINISGSIIHTESHRIPGAPAIIDTLDWSKNEQQWRSIDAGIYIYDVTISSEKDGAGKRVRGRLVLK